MTHSKNNKLKNKFECIIVRVTNFLLINWTEAPVQFSTLFPCIPYGKVLPNSEDSLLQEVNSLLPNGFSYDK